MQGKNISLVNDDEAISLQWAACICLVCTLGWEFFLSQLIVSGCFFRIAHCLFFGKGHSSACLVSFSLLIVSKGEQKAAEKEQGLGERSAKAAEYQSFMYSLRHCGVTWDALLRLPTSGTLQSCHFLSPSPSPSSFLIIAIDLSVCSRKHEKYFFSLFLSGFIYYLLMTS